MSESGTGSWNRLVATLRFAVGGGYGIAAKLLGSFGGDGNAVAAAKANLPAPWKRFMAQIEDNPVWDAIADGVDFYFDAQSAAFRGIRNAVVKPLVHAARHPLQTASALGKCALSALACSYDAVTDAYNTTLNAVTHLNSAIAQGDILAGIEIASEFGTYVWMTVEGLRNSITTGGGGGGGGGGGWRMGPNDLDWRGRPGLSNKYVATRAGVKKAFSIIKRATGGTITRDSFSITRWGVDEWGKHHPVEWRTPGGAEVNIDMPSGHGPQVPHVGYQTPGKRSGGSIRGHILLDDVAYHRGPIGVPDP